ncbi:MAG: DNA helicase RecQ [Gammaproteobacteria bacterium]|jgi:ATP-dependent DNA helicase RecQ
MDDPALHLLNTIFGFAEFRGSQAAIIQQLVNGNDAVVLMPTGGGKSLCYQIPAILRDGTGIVISPLIALMQDQVSSMRQLGVKAACLNSTLDAKQAKDTEQQLLAGQLDLLYVAPERLMTTGFLGLLEQSEIALFAIDEAHCVSQWGHDFRPEYIQLSVLHERFPQIPRIALTATADEPTRNEIIRRLDLASAQQFIASFDRPNICYRITQNQGNARDALLRFILNEHENDAGIVYCLSRSKVEQTAAWLCSKGLTALPYHAGLPPDTRQQHQHRFLMEDSVIIVATIAFGMGIDKPDVRFVAHLNMPKSIEAYYQETGRAGRDGLPADAWMVYGLQDVIKLRQMMDMSAADEQHKRSEQHKLQSMLGFCELTTCRRQGLLRYFGERLQQPCNNCDTCLTPVETWDATVVAQKALSAVHRTGQRFGVSYLVDVLQGKSNERIERFGHSALSVHGVGRELDNQQWRSVFRQLIAHNLLSVDVEGHGNLCLTEACRPVLRGEQKLMLRKESRQAKSARKGRKTYNTAKVSDSQLWDALRACRKQLAEANKVPPYLIFHDATLVEMVERQPQNREQFSAISGVGESKLEKYADDFLAVIQSHITQINAASIDTAAESLRMFKSGLDIEIIAEQRNIKPATVYGHLAACIEQGEIRLQDVVTITDQELSAIQEAILATDDGQVKLKPVYDALDGMFDYNVLRCVRAAMTAG